MNYDAGYLSRVLAGKQRPSPQLATALDGLLGAEGGLAALAAALNSDDRERIERSVAAPSRLDAGTVRALADVLAAQRRLDDTLGPAPMLPATRAQLATVTALARGARGAYAADLRRVAAEWVQFTGWLYAEGRFDDREAVRLLREAQDHADTLGDGPLAAQATNFLGYLARQQQRPRGVVRYFLAAYHTPGATSAQRMGDAAQAAQGLASLGRRDDARRLLDDALDLADAAAAEEPPGTAYWLTGTYPRLNLGLAYKALGESATAAEHIRAGLEGLPVDQQGAAWTVEYQQAFDGC
jgi:tetratricopeptide (TPR) repeat protein